MMDKTNLPPLGTEEYEDVRFLEVTPKSYKKSQLWVCYIKRGGRQIGVVRKTGGRYVLSLGGCLATDVLRYAELIQIANFLKVANL